MTKICTHHGCNEPYRAKGYCNKHYIRNRKCLPMDGPPQRSKVPVSDRFWSKVDIRGEDECWEWTGGRSKDGYGLFTYRLLDGSGKRRTLTSSRLAYELHHGKEIKNQALHHCDNPPCVNPKHLYDGTNKDNARDREERGRNGWETRKYKNRNTARGTRNGKSKLDENKVREIRRLYATGNHTQKYLGEMFGVNQSYIFKIINRKTWRHVD